jgi:hypothetical protein
MINNQLPSLKKVVWSVQRIGAGMTSFIITS